MVTVEALRGLDLEGYLREVEELHCDALRDRFQNAAKASTQAGNDQLAEAWQLLANVCSPRLDLEGRDPFKPLMTRSDGARTVLPCDLDEPALATLREWLPYVQQVDLRARIADIIWTVQRKGNFSIICQGVEDYLAAAAILLATLRFYAPVRLERALQLAYSLSRDELVGRVLETIDRALDSYSERKVDWVAGELFKIIRRRKQGDHAGDLVRLHKFIRQAQDEDNVLGAVALSKLAFEWHCERSALDLQRAAGIELAELLVLEAMGTSPDGMAADTLARAITLMERWGAAPERILELKTELRRLQDASVQSMGRIEIPIEEARLDSFREMAKAARAAVSGKQVGDALRTIAGILPPTSYKDTIKSIEDMVKDGLVYMMFPSTVVNRQGKTIGRAESLLSDQEERINQEYYRLASQHQELAVRFAVNPARLALLAEHSVRIDDIYGLVSQNPFVPEGREVLYAKGLYYSLVGELDLSIQILAPQLENSIRHIYQINGLPTSRINRDQIEEELDPNELLRSPHTCELLGEDLTWELRCLLVERFGSNLRNTVAHGLMDYQEFYSPACLYLWWLTLKLCWLFERERVRRAAEYEDPETQAGS